MEQKEFEQLVQNSHFIQQIHAEIMVGLQAAMCLTMQAAARQIDAQQFANDLRATISAARGVIGPTPPVAAKILVDVLAALDAEAMHQNSEQKPAH